MSSVTVSRPLSVPLPFMLSGLPVQVSDLVASIACEGLASVTLGSGVSVTMCGRYSWSADWIIDVGGDVSSSSHRSYRMQVDGFGRWSVCERSRFIASRGACGGSYSKAWTREGRFASRRGLKELRRLLEARVMPWHLYRVAGFNSYKPTPWK